MRNQSFISSLQAFLNRKNSTWQFSSLQTKLRRKKKSKFSITLASITLLQVFLIETPQLTTLPNSKKHWDFAPTSPWIELTLDTPRRCRHLWPNQTPTKVNGPSLVAEWPRLIAQPPPPIFVLLHPPLISVMFLSFGFSVISFLFTTSQQWVGEACQRGLPCEHLRP